MLWVWEERQERGLGDVGCGTGNVPGAVVQAVRGEELVE
jgi:hypothetical protein